MSSKLFAFQLSRPAESSTEQMSCEYDPQTQTMVWQGGTLARASGKNYCSPEFGGANWCRIIGVGCFLGNACITYGWTCDSYD